MKIHTVSLITLVSLLNGAASVVALAATPDPRPAYAHPVGVVEKGDTRLGRGATAYEFRMLFGEPVQKLNDDTWVYRNFSARSGQARTDDCHQLVVTFKNGRIVDLMLVNPHAAQHIAANIRAANPATGPLVAGTK